MERPEGNARNIRISALGQPELDVLLDQPEIEVWHETIIRYDIGFKEVLKHLIRLQFL
jgi:hypothetical protein